MLRVVDLSTDGLYVAVHRGFLTVSKDREEVGRIALDDIGGVIAHAHGLTWSNTVFVRLSERAVPVVLCSQNHMPVACIWPLEGNHLQGARLNAQASAPRPKAKRIWRDIVVAKIRMQGAVLASVGVESGAFDRLMRKVRSGDPDNVEAQAARRYWQALMGKDFRRDRAAEGTNSLLNYGYTVLRATICRAVCAAGLHPSIGLHHTNRGNAFALADDLMEPYRPLVDRAVYNLVRDGCAEVSPEAKTALAALMALDLPAPHGMSPLHVHATRLAQQLAASFCDEAKGLDLPVPPDPLTLTGLAHRSKAA
ncbi:subtype II CRISPR-associated endonuclease Cas1 [Notoacmeibacter marinus]|uniref:CRISPR-associated endonuclease Cas1 n=1 Tax=Notoacmeibacter marinus TaxID=1876515 RepID=A0A231V1X3_9HYPH|nr:type II CRISPR-associated endonuclease Cas1 [Notoacmeibacter marinus]OXT02140.1 subtype II CRISPR-associated endonuclease Cas1 [Notoacmeibacter marinus]